MADTATKLFYDIQFDDEVYSVRKINEALASAKVEGLLWASQACDRNVWASQAKFDIDAEIAALERDKAQGHCKDCCCAQIWAALGITKYTGKSLVEHIEELVRNNRAKVSG